MSTIVDIPQIFLGNGEVVDVNSPGPDSEAL